MPVSTATLSVGSDGANQGLAHLLLRLDTWTAANTPSAALGPCLLPLEAVCSRLASPLEVMALDLAPLLSKVITTLVKLIAQCRSPVGPAEHTGWLSSLSTAGFAFAASGSAALHNHRSAN